MRPDPRHRDRVTSWSGRLFLAPGIILYLGRGAAADRHAHHAIQFVWAPGGLSLQLGGETFDGRAALVPASVEHAFDARGGALALLLVERHGARGAALDARARRLAGADLAPSLGSLSFPSLDAPSGVRPADASPAAALAWCDAALDALGVPATAPVALSRASRLAIDYVEGALGGTPRLAEAATRSSMSTTRLTHVFSAEVGIPFRRFVLWARLKRAVEATRRGANATEAAVEAGFSDSAHLSRTFRSMFGLPPSMVLPIVEIIGSPWTLR
jgi:AraC-like DNA-binding protein